jgi:hypothetical protein
VPGALGLAHRFCENGHRRLGVSRAHWGKEFALYTFRPVIIGELNAVCLRRDNHSPREVIQLLRGANYEAFAFDDNNFLALHREADEVRARLRRYLRKPANF